MKGSPLTGPARCLMVAVSMVAVTPATGSERRATSETAVPRAEWPQWRGPDRDGASPETGLLEEWPADGPEVLWRIPVGEGFSGVSVSGGRACTLWDEGEGQFLVCLDAATGEERWRYRVDASFTSSWGNGPRSTPAVDGSTIYAVSARGRLHAVQTEDGRPLWSHDLEAEYGGGVPEYGYASSPLIDGDRLIVEVGGREGFAFVAFDKRSGQVVWASQTDVAAYSSPLAITVAGIRQVVFLSGSGLFALAPDDGRLLWKHAWDSRCPATGIPTNVTHPVFIAPDRIFVSGGYGTVTGSAVIQVASDGEGFRTETAWRSERMRNLFNSSVLHGGTIYGFDIGILKAVDARTGEERWKARGFQRGSLIEAEGHLIVLGEEGRLALLEATPTAYREQADAQVLTGRSWTMPALAGGRLFLRNHTEMVSLGLR